MRVPDAWGARLAVLWGLHRLGAPTTLAHRVLLRGHMGAGTRFGRGACAIGRQVRIGANVSIGARTNIVAETIDIADGVTIGDDVVIRCKTLRLGRGSRIDERTRIYGIVTPRSGLELGEHAWIYADCHVNTDDLVRFGARSAMGARSLIFTHSSYLPITHGYPVSVGPVTVGDDVWLPWQVFLLPGAVVGDGATIGANSLVVGEIPPYSLATGIPAKVIKDASRYRRQYDRAQLVTLARRITGHAIEYAIAGFRPATVFRATDRRITASGDDSWTLHVDGSDAHVYLVADPSGPLPVHDRDRALLVLVEASEPPRDASWIDVVRLTSSISPSIAPVLRDVIGALSTYGIRFGWMPEDAAQGALASLRAAADAAAS